MIQNTGLGNLITELYTLQKLYREGLPILVSWRGYYDGPIEAQTIFGGKVEDLLIAIDIEYKIVRNASDVDAIGSDIAGCFEQGNVKVYLMSPEVWETNSTDFLQRKSTTPRTGRLISTGWGAGFGDRGGNRREARLLQGN